MSRVTELIFWINKDLVTYNIRKVNDPEIVSAINKGIEKICSLQNVVEGEIPVTLVTGTTVYALPAYFKKATGIVFPRGFVPHVEFMTRTQFDQKLTHDRHLPFPKYACIKNNAFNLWGPPTSDINGSIITIQAYFNTQITPASLTFEPVTPLNYDTAIRYFADYYLSPIDNDARDKYELEFLKQIDSLYPNLKETDTRARAPECNW